MDTEKDKIEITIDETDPGKTEEPQNDEEKESTTGKEEIWIKKEPLDEESEQTIDPDILLQCNVKIENIVNEQGDSDVKPVDTAIDGASKDGDVDATQETGESADLKPKTESENIIMYSYEVTKNIEVVTIDEEERQKEHQETLKGRRHMRYVCEECAVGYVVEDAFLMHRKVHTKESGDHECEICHSFLKSADMLYRHRLRHYRRYRCLLCWVRFKDKDSAACHVMTEHVGQRFDCDRCGRGFKRPQYLKKHVEQHHTKPVRLECGICSRVFHERGWYRSHVRTHNEEVRSQPVKLSICHLCSRQFKSKSSLKRHLASHELENLECDICYEKFINKHLLGQHYLKVHNTQYEGAPEETCPHCYRICATRAMLKRHMQRMHTDRTKKYECWHCSRLYLTKGEVRSHIVWCHLPADSRSGHSCKCGRLFRTPSLLKDHVTRAHSDMPAPRIHACIDCGKAFANKQVLNRHMKSHSNEMYPCKECGLLFKTQPYVKVHYQIKHLNMTRAQIKAQRKLNREKMAQKTIDNGTTCNWEPQIKNKKKKKEVKSHVDPLSVEQDNMVQEVVQVKIEKDAISIPLFETFNVD